MRTSDAQLGEADAAGAEADETDELLRLELARPDDETGLEEAEEEEATDEEMRDAEDVKATLLLADEDDVIGRDDVEEDEVDDDVALLEVDERAEDDDRLGVVTTPLALRGMAILPSPVARYRAILFHCPQFCPELPGHGLAQNWDGIWLEAEASELPHQHSELPVS